MRIKSVPAIYRSADLKRLKISLTLFVLHLPALIHSLHYCAALGV